MLQRYILNKGSSEITIVIRGELIFNSSPCVALLLFWLPVQSLIVVKTEKYWHNCTLRFNILSFLSFFWNKRTFSFLSTHSRRKHIEASNMQLRYFLDISVHSRLHFERFVMKRSWRKDIHN